MNGAESLVRTLVGGGVNVCFANPGTSEMHFVAALDSVPGIRCVLCLFEGEHASVRRAAEQAEIPFERILETAGSPWPLTETP